MVMTGTSCLTAGRSHVELGPAVVPRSSLEVPERSAKQQQYPETGERDGKYQKWTELLVRARRWQ
jgi:hypothetical protein